MAEHQKLFSIIIPSFNSLETIRQCLESTIREFHNGNEIIVVDDNSTDGSNRIISEYPVKLLKNCSTLGAGAARNNGLKVAIHDWILFIDSDIVVKEGTQRVLQEAVRKYPEDVTFGSISDTQPANRGIFHEFLACRAHYQYAAGPEHSTAFPSQLVLVKKHVF